MRKSLTAVLAAATLLLGACGGGSGAASPSVAARVSAPSPDAAQSEALLAALGAVDPSLNEDKSVSRARDMCASMLAEARGEGGTKPLADVVRVRFTADQLTDAQSQQVLDAISAGGWCAE